MISVQFTKIFDHENLELYSIILYNTDIIHTPTIHIIYVMCRIYDIVKKHDVFALWILHVIFSPLAGIYYVLIWMKCVTIFVWTGALVAIVMYGVERDTFKRYSLSSVKVS